MALFGSYHPLQDTAELPRTAYSFAAIPAPPTMALEEEVRADIAIVGAGFTGLSAALHAAEAGASAVVLEANEIGWGASGRTFGQVVPYLRHSSAHALKSLGPEYGRRMIEAAAGGPDLLFALVEKYAIDCQATRTGLIFAAHAPGALPGLEQRTAEWRRLGAPVEMLNADQTRTLVGGGSYWGSALDRRGGTINALSYTRGLAAAAMQLGARVHTGSRVIALTREGGGWRLATARGSVLADTVMLCTSGYTDGLRPELQASLVPLRAYGVVSRPVSENVRASILPQRQALTEARRMASGIRIYPDGRIHMTGDGARFGPEGKPDSAALARRLLRIFPQLGGIEWEGSWSGWIDMTPSQFPALHELAPALLAGLGYSGRGIALGTVMGRELVRCATGTPAAELHFAVSRPRRVPFASLARPAVEALIGLKRLQDTIELLRWQSGPRPA